MKFGFISLGCCKNLVDSEQLMGMLVASDQEIVTNPMDADVIVVNTCGFIESAKEESINTILEMAEYGKKLIVTGCLAQRYKEELQKELKEVSLFVTLDEYPNIHKILSDFLGIRITKPYGKSNRLLSSMPWTAYLKIADGCSNRCAYCAIPLIRGPYRSYKIEEVVEEAKLLYEQGVKELVLIAQDTTRYGIDIYNDKRALLDLLKEVNKIDFHWIRILYMYPDEIDDELIIGMSKLDKVIPYFDIPVQYGEDHMLKLMNRRGTVESILHTVDLIRKTFKRPVLRTTMIVGFPHETEESFQTTLRFMERCKWDRLGAFTYSKEENTPAYDMDEEVPQEVMDRRLNEMMDLQTKIVEENNQKLIGETLEVLIENYDGLTGRYIGRSIYSAPDGIDGVVFVKSDKEIEFGTFVNAKITRVRKHDLIAEY